MNILWLTPEIPYPPVGGRNGVYNRIVQLSKNNRIFLLSIAYNSTEKDWSSAMEKYCTEVYYFDRSAKKKKNMLKSLRMPWSIASRNMPEIKKTMVRILKNKKIDVIIDDFPNMAKNILDIKANYPELLSDVYCTLNQHNIEYIRMRKMKHVKSISALKRIVYWLESLRLEAYEKTIYKSGIFDSITFFSSDDKVFFENRWKGIGINSEVKVFPLGANRITLEKTEKITSKAFLFVGRLDEIAIPNVEAALWFANNVFPLILKEEPDAKFIIAGSNPSERIMHLKSESIEIIPNYKSLEEVYSKSQIVLLPLLSGGGVKGKLLEAAALKKIIITTQHGIEGTKFVADKDVLLANNARDFARHCINAIKEPDRYDIMRKMAHKKFLNEYDWAIIGEKYQVFLRDNCLRKRKMVNYENKTT